LGSTIASVTQKEAKAYCAKRSKEKWHGRETRPYTIRKELRTFRDVWEWANGEGLIPILPPWEISSLPLGRDRGREPFRMFDEIETRIKRGGLSAHEEADLWECLYLTGEQVREVLDFVQSEPCAPFVYPMICFAALTGARRAELLRSRIDDWELGEDRKVVHIRELKRDTSREFTMRSVDLHPRLVEVMRAWFADHPGGQFALCRPDGSALTPDQATDRLNRVLGRHDKWKRLPGFHTFRHSFASILAANNEDQRTIDALMGHQTDDMRHRYQHIFPPKKRRAVDGILP
jgi:integrase